MTRYTFGDSEITSERLELLAEVFRPSSRDFLLHAAPAKPNLALDLGCGPGDTTCLLAETVSPERTVGLERSRSFLEIARRQQTDRVSFVEHDITEIPFPTGPADVIYARFLLLHLLKPTEIVARWMMQLIPGGLLLLEEVEQIETTDPMLARYLEIVEAMMASHGQALYAGNELAALEIGGGWRSRQNRLVEVLPGSRRAARMFLLNLAGWRDDPAIKEIASRAELAQLSDDLVRLVAAPTAADIAWKMRQVALERH